MKPTPEKKLLSAHESMILALLLFFISGFAFSASKLAGLLGVVVAVILWCVGFRSYLK